MKLLNYDTRYLIMQNVRTVTKEVPDTYTKCQYRILCRAYLSIYFLIHQ